MKISRRFFVVCCTAATLAVYFLYACVLVPIGLPTRDRGKLPTPPKGPVQDRELLEILFPPNSWVFEEPQPDSISFSDDAGVVLFQKFDFEENGSQARISPCVVLWFPSDHKELSREEKYRQAVVLEAENYALLEFDGPMDFARIPPLKGGELKGIVRIRSDMKTPDTSDDIKLTTSDVMFDFNRIETRERVDFEFGPNKGSGRHLTIQMGNTDESKKGEAPNTIRKMELERLDVLRLYVENDALNYSAGTTRAAATVPTPQYHVAAYPQVPPSDNNMFRLGPETSGTSPGISPGLSTPATNTPVQGGGRLPQTRPPASTAGKSEVSVRCNGSVDLVGDANNAGQWLLTFRDQVSVIRSNPQGASDQLNCRELILTFGQKEASQQPDADKNPLASFGSLTPLRVKAIGAAAAPVVARSPENNGFLATGREMLLDLVRKQLDLTQGDEVSVTYDRYKIKGKALYYSYDGNDGPGKLDMPRGGTLEGMTGADADKPFKLTWEDGLKVLPDGDNPKLSVVEILGKPKAVLADIGTATADEIRIWCDMSKKTPGIAAVSDDALNADVRKIVMKKNVILKTDSGEILTNELAIDFQQPGMTAQSTPQTTRSVVRYPDPQARGTSQASSSNGKLSQLSFFGNSDGSKSSYTVRADRVDVLARMVGKEAVAEQILLTTNVKLDEKLSTPGQEPIHVAGQRVKVTNPNTEQMVIIITGNDRTHAVFQGRGVNLVGANINVNRGENRFRMDGPGELRISQQAMASAVSSGSRDGFGKLFTPPTGSGPANQAVIIEWRGSMTFDGKLLSFIKDVNVNYTMMAINKSDRIDIWLSKPFRFFEKDSTNDIEPERVRVYGNIELERDNFAENNGGQQSHDRIKLTAAEFFPITGAFKGLGPGYVSSIFLDKGNGAGGLIPTGTGTTSSSTSEASGIFGKGMKFMQCNFNDSVEGNYKTNQVTFNDRVMVMLCPAQSFRDVINTNNPRNIVANGMLLECNKLEITQPPQGVGNTSYDLKAEGNTRIEMTYDGRYYATNANKVKFEQAKNLLTMEGGPHSLVELYEAASMHAPLGKPLSGERLYFNTVTKEPRVDNFNFSGQFSLP